MKNILFTHSYFYRFDPKQWKFKQPYPPLATILAAAVLRNEGFKVSLLDTNLENDPQAIVPVIHKTHAHYIIIYDDGFNYLTKMCLTKMRSAAFAMAREAKKLGCIVIMSGSDAADHYEKYFTHGVDYVVRGEGELTLKALMLALERREDVTEIHGLAFKKLGQTIVTAPRPVLRDLDTLPLPAWDLIDMAAYRRIWLKHHRYFSINIATTRGCPYKCNWCAKPIYGNRYNSRSAAHVLQEIEFLIKNYQAGHFWMCDDIFGLKPGWVQEFRDLVRSKKLNFRYKIQSRADLLLEKDTVEALAQSGVETVWIGAESGSQKILDAMDKGTTIAQIHKATQLLRENKIKIGFFLQFGYMGETKEDIRKTIDMVVDLLPDEVGISISYPLPGTKFYEKVKNQLGEKENWSDSDDLAMLFENTFTSAYYRQLHRYVHSVYRKHKGFSNLKKLFSDPLRLNYKDLRSGLATFYYIPKAFAQHIKLKALEVA